MKKILFINIASFILLISYSFLKVKECIAYWMHDGAVDVNHNQILYFCLYSFLFPILLFYFQQKFNPNKRIQKAFIFQYVFAVFSILSLFLSIINPIKTQVVDNTTYIFTSSSFTFSYYLFKILNFIFLFFIVLKIILSAFYHFTKSTKNNEIEELNIKTNG
jgi:hypothetical protein